MTRAHPSIRLGLHLGLAHHPLCSRFRADVVHVGRAHLCSGCLATWPAFALVLPMALLARLQGAPAWALLAAGLVLGLPQMASYGWRRSRAERAAAKVVGGAGLALALTGLLGLGLPGPALLGVLIAGGAGSIALQGLRMRAILATCDACPFRRAWDRCPGFQAGMPPTDPTAPAPLLSP